MLAPYDLEPDPSILLLKESRLDLNIILANINSYHLNWYKMIIYVAQYAIGDKLESNTKYHFVPQLSTTLCLQ